MKYQKMREKWKGGENVLESLNYTLKNKEINVFFIIERILLFTATSQEV